LPTRQNPVDGAWIPTISLNPAAELGELKVICDHPSDAAPEQFDAACVRLAKALDLATENDYIVMAGDVVLCAYAIHCVLTFTGVANVLRWNREERQYDHITIED